MHLGFFAIYAGPDQVMTVTSGLASLVGLLLIFWNKVVAVFARILGRFQRSEVNSSTPPAQGQASKSTPEKTS